MERAQENIDQAEKEKQRWEEMYQEERDRRLIEQRRFQEQLERYDHLTPRIQQPLGVLSDTVPKSRRSIEFEEKRQGRKG